MSFEYYYITVVGLVILVVALLIGIIMNTRYYRVIKEMLSQTREETELKGSPASTASELEVLMCPRCGYSKVISFRVGDYVGKVVEDTCPKDGEKLVVHAIYSSRSVEQQP